MATRIQRLATLWGTAEEIETDPDIEIHRHAVYVPASGTTWHTVVPGPGGTDEGGGPPDRDRPAGVETAAEATYILVEGMTEHYGHFIVDCLSRLWPLARWAGEPVKLVCEARHGRAFWESHAFLREILEGLGLGLDDLVTFDHSVVLPRVMRPAPSFRSLESVNTVFGDLCRKVGRRYWSDDEIDSVARPAYLSKLHLTSGMHHLANETEVVAALARLGADILFPEEMTFAEQVREFARRRVVMGPVGSAFHTSAFSAPARRMIGLSGLAHMNSNYVLVDRISRAHGYYYFVPETTYADREGFGLSWTIPEPRRVAAQMMARAENIDRIDAYEREVVAEQMRKGPGLVQRVRRAASTRWSRMRQSDRDGGE